MEIKAKVQLTKKELFKFLFYHMYMNTSGIIYTVVAAAALAGGIYYLICGNTTGIFLVAVTLIYFAVMPLMLYLKAVKQSKNEVFQTPTDYRMDAEGIHASKEGGEEDRVAWDQVRKVISFWGIYIVYLSAVRASILPVESFEADQQKVNDLFLSVLPKNRLKGIRK